MRHGDSLGAYAFRSETLKVLALVLLAVFTAAAQTGPVVLKSPNGALEISIATVRGQSVLATGGQLAYRVTFRGQPVIEWSNLGLAVEGATRTRAGAARRVLAGVQPGRYLDPGGRQGQSDTQSL